MMINQKAPTQEEAMATTWVVWDIKSCPVPDERDARRVGPCIKRALKNLGYSGPVTITAIGDLTDIPDNLVRSISSTGIALWQTPPTVVSMAVAIFGASRDRQRLANLLLISGTSVFYHAYEPLRGMGYNILPQNLYVQSSPPIHSDLDSTEVEALWKRILTDTMDSEEKCSETSECIWSCTVCRDDAGNDVAGKGFGNFTTHCSIQEHRDIMLRYMPDASNEEEVEASLDSQNASSSMNKEPKRKCQKQRRKCKKPRT